MNSWSRGCSRESRQSWGVSSTARGAAPAAATPAAPSGFASRKVSPIQVGSSSLTPAPAPAASIPAASTLPPDTSATAASRSRSRSRLPRPPSIPSQRAGCRAWSEGVRDGGGRTERQEGGGGGAARVRALPRREAPRPGHPPCPFRLTESLPLSELRGRSRLRLGAAPFRDTCFVPGIVTTTAARPSLSLSPRALSQVAIPCLPPWGCWGCHTHIIIIIFIM